MKKNTKQLSLLLSFSLTLLLAIAPVVAQESQTNRLSAEYLFESDRIVDISIELPKEDWDAIRVQSRSFPDVLGKQPATRPFMYVQGNITIDGQRIEGVGIRKKGFLGSLHNDRPSLKIKFSEYRDQEPINGLDRLTLNNNNQDPARVCQFLAYKMYNDSGTISPRCGFAKVTVNGNYLGIYSNVESIKPAFLKRGFGDGTGDLFEGTVADFFPQWTQKFEPKNKKASYQDINRIAEILNAKEIDLGELEKLIDIDSFLKFWAMESLLGFWDGYCANQNNFFIYQDPANSKFYFIPWGTDSALTQTTPLPPYRIRPKSVHAKAILPNRLYRIPAKQKRYVENLMSFLDDHWNEEKLLSELDRLETLLKNELVESNEEFSETMEKYRRFIRSRRANLMREFKQGPPELPSREHFPTYFAEIGKATVTFSTKWYDKSPGWAAAVGQVELDLEVDGEKVELENVSAYAERSTWPSPEKVKPPSIVITGTRKSDGKRLTLGVSMANELFKPTGGNATAIAGIFFVDFDIMPKSGMQMVGGTATLEKASVENGQPVVGKLNLTIKRMIAGQPVAEK